MSTDPLGRLRIIGLVVVMLTVAGLSAIVLSFTSRDDEDEADHAD